jgi:AraC-like DNA-binding protein
MNYNEFSPYIRVAMKSYLQAPFKIYKRILFDYELIFMQDGKWELIIDDKSYICKMGDVILIRPNQPHEIRSIDRICVSQPHIHFDFAYDEYSENVYVSFKNIIDFSAQEKAMIRPDIFANTQLNSPILKISDLKYFTQIFFEIIDIFTTKPIMYQLQYKQKMLKLLTYILKENISNIAQDKNQDHNLICLVKDYIDNNYLNIITLNTLEHQFYYNKYYISKQFTKTFKIPVIKYYNNLRIETAKDAILNGVSVTKTASLLNFNSIFMFSRFFKNSTGISPTEYLKIHLNKNQNSTNF